MQPRSSSPAASRGRGALPRRLLADFGPKAVAGAVLRGLAGIPAAALSARERPRRATGVLNRRRAQRAQTDDPTLPVILEYQWPSTAIVNAPIPRVARSIVQVIASMVFLLVAAMALIPIDQVVTARGLVVSQWPTILVQPLDTAIVRSIDVHVGQVVHAGELLARLDPTFAAADMAALSGQVSGLDATVTRLQAEAADAPFTYAGSDPDWRLQAEIYGHRKAEFDAKIDNYRHKINEDAAVRARSESDAAGYRERLGFAQDIEHMRKELEALQAGTKLNTLLAMDTRAELARSLANAQQTAEQARLDQAALVAERDGYVRGWRADVGEKLADAMGKQSDAREALNKAKLRRQLVELRSEGDAIVQSLAKVSVGSVMQSGQPFITLVPEEAPLEVEANIAGQDNGFVHLHDPVAIKFDTFPFSQYGMAEGIVRVISPDSFTSQTEERNPTSAVPVPLTATIEPFYRARISIDKVALHDVPEGFRVAPGMPVTADIKVGKRTVLKYLLGRILPLAQEGMREP